MTADDCLFCRIIAGDVPSERVAESEQTVAFRDIHPAAPVHVLVVPKRHVANVAALAKASSEELADLFAVVAQVTEKEEVAEHHRLVFNTGSDGGQTIFHAHAHVLGGRVFTER